MKTEIESKIIEEIKNVAPENQSNYLLVKILMELRNLNAGICISKESVAQQQKEQEEHLKKLLAGFDPSVLNAIKPLI